MSTDYLIDDPVIENQKFACISYITPDSVKGCNKRLIKVSGLYSDKDIAENRCKELNDNTFPIGVVEVGKWIAFPDNDSNSDDPVNELNDLMKLYLEEREVSKKEHEDRKKNYKDAIKNENYDIKEDDCNDQDNNLEIKEISSNTKEISHLKNDNLINGQKLFIISFLVPEQVNNGKQYKVRGFKVRESFDNEEESKTKCEKFHKLENNHNSYVGLTGTWVEWSHNPNVENTEYSNKELDKIMKAQKENQEKAREFNRMNENTQNNIIDNVIEEDDEENIKDDDDDDDDIENINEKLKSVNDELNEAKEQYRNMLNSQNK